MKKSELDAELAELDALAADIKLARQMIEKISPMVNHISHTTATIEHAARQGMFIKAVPQDLKDRLSKLIDSMRRCRELLNQAEPGSRGLQASHLLEELWRALP